MPELPWASKFVWDIQSDSARQVDAHRDAYRTFEDLTREDVLDAIVVGRLVFRSRVEVQRTADIVPMSWPKKVVLKD